jgi:hypothetical protein
LLLKRCGADLAVEKAGGWLLNEDDEMSDMEVGDTSYPDPPNPTPVYYDEVRHIIYDAEQARAWQHWWADEALPDPPRVYLADPEGGTWTAMPGVVSIDLSYTNPRAPGGELVLFSDLRDVFTSEWLADFTAAFNEAWKPLMVVDGPLTLAQMRAELLALTPPPAPRRRPVRQCPRHGGPAAQCRACWRGRR